MARLLHPRPDAAHLLAISLRRLDYLIKSKDLSVIRIGKRTLVSQAELERFARCGTEAKQGGGSHVE